MTDKVPEISAASVYCKSRPASAADLTLMDRIEKLGAEKDSILGGSAR
jgi:hypothetical protein